jgi:UDP-3-O-[3-hydroxymyristoyl] glucosamine N-acyltransferase
VATIHDIAKLTGAAEPAASAELTRVSSIEAAGLDSVVFATDPGTYEAAVGSPAGAILVSEGVLRKLGDAAGRDGRGLAVPEARYAFALVARDLEQRQQEARTAAGANAEAQVHPTAVLGERVRLGPGTRVGPHVVLGDGVMVGSDCRILANATVYAGTTIGSRVVIQAGAVLGSTGFGYARNPASGEYILFPQHGALVIEDDVEIGANTTIDRGALGETRIGAGTKIDNLVHIGHNCVVGRNVVIAAQTGISGSSVVEDGAILGGQVGLGEHAQVGPGVILGGGAGVLSHKKVRGAGQVFWGRPARPLKQYLRDLARLSRG